jgi:hypothetical protein
MHMFALFFAFIFMASAQTATAATFGGYECTEDCSGHAAGYKWAEEHDITEEQYCPEGDFQSFHEGCVVHTNEPSRGATEDDDGNPIEEK